MSQLFAIGVDIGGSHISCAVCNLTDKKYLSNTFSNGVVNNRGEAVDIFNSWIKTLNESIDKAEDIPIRGIGFAMPGPFDYIGGTALFKGNNHKYESLYGINISEVLLRGLSFPADFPIRFINDATAFAIGESWFGKTSCHEKTLAITLGTGFGSAFINKGLPVVSGDKVPETGAVWHLPFADGNADDYFSTRGLLARYAGATGKWLHGVKELAQEVQSDREAKAVFDDLGQKLGEFLAPWIINFDAEAIIIGGNISNAFNLFENKFTESLKKNGVNINVYVSELKETASLIGSAMLVEDAYYQKLISTIADM